MALLTLALASPAGVYGVLTGMPAADDRTAQSTAAPPLPRSASPSDPSRSVPEQPPATNRGTITEVPDEGPGRFRIAPVSRSTKVDDAVRFTIEVERNLPFGPRDVAELVADTLGDPRGWTARGGRHFAQVVRHPELRVLLTTPTTTDRLCAPLHTRGRVSCRSGSLVVLNALRWVEGVPGYEGRLRAYRRYMVNHEVGHFLGWPHVPCPGRGHLAPVMQQQTYGLDGCRPNPWPSPSV